MVDYSALGIRATGGGHRARVDTLVIDTSHIAGTSRIRSATLAAHQTLAYFTLPAIIIAAADRLTAAIFTPLVVEAAYIVRAQGTTHFSEAGKSFGTLTILSTR